MKYVVVNKTRNCIYPFKVDGRNRRIFSRFTDAVLLCKGLRYIFPDKYEVVRCKSLTDCRLTYPYPEIVY